MRFLLPCCIWHTFFPSLAHYWQKPFCPSPEIVWANQILTPSTNETYCSPISYLTNSGYWSGHERLKEFSVLSKLFFSFFQCSGILERLFSRNLVYQCIFFCWKHSVLEEHLILMEHLTLISFDPYSLVSGLVHRKKAFLIKNGLIFYKITNRTVVFVQRFNLT